MAKEDDILRDAIIGTEKEIFGDAFGKDEVTLDETGDRSLEAIGDGLEGQHEPDDEDETEDEQEASEQGTEGEGAEGEHTAKDGDAEPKPGDRQQDSQGRVPAGRLREQTEARRAAEAERDALKAQIEAEKTASQKAIADLNAKFEGVLAAIQRGQQPAPKPAEPPKPEVPPDLFENPQAFAEYIVRQNDAKIAAMQQQVRAERINMSMEMARSRHGETFDAAFTALRSLDPSIPDNRALVQSLTNQPNPGEAVVTWHKRNQALREVGDDPAAYKAKIAEETRKALAADPEFRKQLLESLRAEAVTGDNGQPRTAVRLPPSLGRTPGNNTRAPNDLDIFDGSPEAIFNSAWG